MGDGGMPARDEDLSETLHRLVAGLLRHLQVRLKLLQEEITEERDRVGALLWRGALAVFLSFLTLELCVVLVMAAAWDTGWRVPAAGGLLLLSAGGTAYCIVRWKRDRRNASKLFAASLAEIAKDREAVDRL